MKNIPIPTASAKQKKEIADVVNVCLLRPKSRDDGQKQLDELVAKLYNVGNL